MARIRVVAPTDATGPLKEVYNEVARTRGGVANILQAQSLNPRALRAHLDLYMVLMFGESKLSRRERELLAVVTSRVNRCDYCIAHHSEALGRYLKDAPALQALREGRDSQGLTPREVALVEWARALGRSPPEVRDVEATRLRDAGLSDEEVLDATQIAAYFCFVNRIAVGLDVELEPGEGRSYRH